MASHQGRVGTLSGTMTKDYVQIVQNCMTRVTTVQSASSVMRTMTMIVR